ncbi:MAG: (2Fe-2S)-binding protein, partial [Desulfobacterales bacterium]|nr:(2Fe-2S)-binding protein [Desulfobacterales bacterium]
MVDYRKDPEFPRVTLPYEIHRENVEKGEKIFVTDVDGAILGRYEVARVIANKKKHPGTFLVQVIMEKALAKKAIGVLIADKKEHYWDINDMRMVPDEAVVCRCERVTAGEIRTAIQNGARDINQLKALNRTGMGACGSKTCRPMVWRMFQEEGVDMKEVTDRVDRPLFVEVPMGVLAGLNGGERDE